MENVIHITNNIENKSDKLHFESLQNHFEALRTIRNITKSKGNKISPEDLIELSKLIEKFTTTTYIIHNSIGFMQLPEIETGNSHALIISYSNLIREYFAIEETKISHEEQSHTLQQELLDLKSELEKIRAEGFTQELNSAENLLKTAQKIQDLESNSKSIETIIQGEIDKSLMYYEETSLEIDEKRKQINNILEIASSDVLSGDHGKNAAKEEKTANRLRILSVTCMILILGILGFTIWESTKSNFSWDVALFRVSIAFLLSVPAAYLARESAKHREQQYYYRQTALNLKAISPYIASLPEQEQHKLKIDIAASIFSGRETTKFDSDPYPINTQEILMALLSKIETPSKTNNQSSQQILHLNI